MKKPIRDFVSLRVTETDEVGLKYGHFLLDLYYADGTTKHAFVCWTSHVQTWTSANGPWKDRKHWRGLSV